jgi:hypothetical protein
MGKHTVGPWQAILNGVEWQVNSMSAEFPDACVADAFESSEIYDVDGNVHDHGEANARLIAAAPDLLEALEALVSADSVTMHSAMIRAESAIKKARGES